MRIKKRKTELISDYRLMIIDDDEGLLDSISVFLERNGYDICSFSNPVEGLEELQKEKYDLLVLDYFMVPIKGDDVVARLREFDRELYVILLTGHKDLAPPLTTIREFDIQAYCEKSPRLDQLLLLIESGIKSINQMRRIRKFRDGLNNILTAVPKIYQLKPLEEILEAILAQMLNLFTTEDAFIFIDGFSGNSSGIFKGVGIFNDSPEIIHETFNHDFLEAMGRAKTENAVSTTDVGIIFPLKSLNKNYKGIIYIAGKLEEDNRNLLEIFISQAASSIQNAHMHSVMDKQAEDLAFVYSALKTNYMETVEALRLAVDAKDFYTRGHSDRVAMYSKLIGKRLGLSENDLEDLRIGGLFHDIGKIGTSDDVLLKTTKLNEEEFEEIKVHPIKGAMILSAISAFSKIKDIVSSHHERIDGRGYPMGLTGDEIPYAARIISIADAYDAMTSSRQYRSKLSKSEALDQLRKGCGTQFDKDIVKCFISIIEEVSEEVGVIEKFETF